MLVITDHINRISMQELRKMQGAASFYLCFSVKKKYQNWMFI